jgi:16S rRNA (adenine1518-N6/adenine1519-N6)-dimethyltransferase
VHSAVISLDTLSPPRAEETPLFRQLVRSAFEARRKTLRNAWRRLAPVEALEAAASEAGISLQARGETLSVEEFAAMAKALARTAT